MSRHVRYYEEGRVKGDLRPRRSPSSVGARGFEPPTPTTPLWCATRLRYAPMCHQDTIDSPLRQAGAVSLPRGSGSRHRRQVTKVTVRDLARSDFDVTLDVRWHDQWYCRASWRRCYAEISYCVRPVRGHPGLSGSSGNGWVLWSAGPAPEPTCIRCSGRRLSGHGNPSFGYQWSQMSS